MGTIMDYMDWRGDITLDQSPFNEVDNLILAQMSYVDLDGIVPGINERESITIAEAAQIYMSHHTIEEMDASSSFIRYAPLVLDKMGKCRRYANATITNYINQVDFTEQKQFCAMHINLSDKTTYIAFRGTDDTLVGWQEDFNMSYRTVPAQEEAVIYVNQTVKGLMRKYRMGGHSKGGNLAVYAGVNCSPNIRKHIIQIYNNDGPGFIAEVLDNPLYNETLQKVQTYVPENSVIGMLLEHAGEHKVVQSIEKGLMQHDAMSWKVLGTRFLYCQSTSNESQLIDEIITGWLGELDVKTKEEFVQSLFDMVAGTGAKNLSDIIAGGAKSLLAILKQTKGLSEGTKASMARLIKMTAERVIMDKTADGE